MKRALLIVAAVGVAATLALLLRPPRRTLEALTARRGAFRFNWPRGTAYTYDVRWRGDSALSLPGESEPFASRYELDGELTLRSLGKMGVTNLFAVELGPLRRHALAALGKELLPGDADVERDLAHRRCWVELGDDGGVRAIHLREDDPDVFKLVARGLVTHLTVTVPPTGEAEWTAGEWTTSGKAVSAYGLVDGSGLALVRAHTRYDELSALPGGSCAGCRQRLAAHAAIALAAAGHLERLDDEESLAVARPDGEGARVTSHDAFALALRAVTTGPLTADVWPDWRRVKAYATGQPSAFADNQRALREQRIAGLDYEGLTTGIVVAGLRGAPRPGFVTRAAALVQEHPEYAGALARVFTDGETRPRARALIADILTSAGNKEAQAALREALSSPVAKQSPDYKLLMQRFSLLGQPDAQSARFVAELYERAPRGADSGLRYAGAYALGAVAGKLARGGDEAEARGYDRRLRADLGQAGSAKERAVLLEAVGAEGLAENVAVLVPYARDADADVRVAAANALRASDGADVRATLLGLVGDRDARVEEAALGAFEQRRLDGDDVRALADRVAGGATVRDLDGSLVTFFAKHAGDGGDVRGALDYLLGRAGDPLLRVRIRHVLAQLPRG